VTDSKNHPAEDADHAGLAQLSDPADPAEVDALEAALVGPSMADRVEMVLRPLGRDRYRARSALGSVEFERTELDGRYDYRVVHVEGRNPLERQDTNTLLGVSHEPSTPPPTVLDNSFPHAFDSIAQFFDSEHAPDLLATHSASHTREQNVGHHGSLGIVQARAPFIAAGAGVANLGVLDRSTRVVDVAPTIARLLGIEPHPDGVGPTGAPRADALLRRQDGDPLLEILDGTTAEHVVVILLDGCNVDLLHDVVAAGEAPNVASLIERGVSMRRGAFASLPTATLANHTTAVTGAHPGHSGVLHNAWIDRTDGSSPDLLGMDQMFWAMQHMNDDVETLFQALQRCRPGSFSTATFEFCDTGASFSSFAEVRAGTSEGLPDLDDVTHVDRPSADVSDAYRFMSIVDHVSVEHTLRAWRQDLGNPLPALSWCSLAVTDEAGHESGPHGPLTRAAVRDSDARIGELLRAVEVAGVADSTAIVVIADHGMEQSDPSADRPWDDDLAACGVAHRIVGDGFVYLDGGQ